MQKLQTISRKRALSTAVAAAVLGLVGAAAQAEVVAIGTNQLTGFTISASGGTLSFSDDPATRSATNGATFNGSGPSVSETVTPPAGADPAPATSGPGPFPADNAGYNQTSTVTFTGGFGDTEVFGNFLAGGSTVNSTGQARLPGVDGGDATGSGRVLTAGSILLTLTGTTSATLTMSFSNDLNLYVSSDLAGGTAQASSTAQFTIRDSSDAVVFNFTPNGAAGGNGLNTTETSDPVDLNVELSALGAETNTLNPGIGTYSAFTTDPLAAGTYRLELLVANSAVVRQNTVPEPSSVLLTALGLTAAGIVTRRRKPQA